MKTRSPGSTGLRVSEIGLGCMGMSDLYGPADEAESIATIHAALDAGITLLDTGDFYGMGHNELLLNKALQGRAREQVVISVKFGALRDPDGGWAGNDGRPTSVKNFLAYTLRRLGTDYVDVYRLTRVDPTVLLSRGLISGHWSKERALTSGDFRGASPRFSGENLERNLALVEALRAIADAKGATVAQVAIAWVLSRGRDIVPLVGARRRDRLTEALGALELNLTAEDLTQIETAVPAGAAAGDRYAAFQMAHLDSERRQGGNT